MTRLLLIADDAFDDARAVPTCVAAMGDVDEVHVVAPVIASRLDVLTEDEGAYRDATARANRIAEALGERGISATSDRSTEDPFDTAVTTLQAGEYDGVVVATTGQGHWREEGAVDRLRETVDVPVTEVVVDDGDA